MLMPGDVAEAMTQPENVWRCARAWIRPGDAHIGAQRAVHFHSLIRQALARPAHLHRRRQPRTRRHRSSARACARHPRRGEPRLEVRLPGLARQLPVGTRAPHVGSNRRRRCALAPSSRPPTRRSPPERDRRYLEGGKEGWSSLAALGPGVHFDGARLSAARARDGGGSTGDRRLPMGRAVSAHSCAPKRP